MGPPHLAGMATDEALSQLRIQEYYDDLSKLNIPLAHSRWYNIDVASLLNGISIIGYEVDSDSGASLLLLEKSAILCCPGSGRIHHYPKNLIHCFIDDSRSELKNLDGIILKVELFSISPNEEQLCWECSCRSELEVPEIQRKAASWLTWLNQ